MTLALQKQHNRGLKILEAHKAIACGFNTFYLDI